MINDLKGKTINKFKILNDSGKRRMPGNNIMWNALCFFCKTIKPLTSQELKKYISCGCKKSELQGKTLRKVLNKGGYKEIFATHWNGLIKNAKCRNLDFNLDVKYAWKLFLKQKRKCNLSGVDLTFSKKCWGNDTTASLDRIDSKKGYVIGNVQWVHKNINMMKQEYTTKQFLEWCKKVTTYNKLK